MMCVVHSQGREALVIPVIFVGIQVVIGCHGKLLNLSRHRGHIAGGHSRHARELGNGGVARVHLGISGHSVH